MGVVICEHFPAFMVHSVLLLLSSRIRQDFFT